MWIRWRALGAADEKSGADINKLIVSLTAVIKQYKCAVLLVHHTGHSEAAQHRARGASELPAAVDHEFRVEPYEEAGIITGTLFTSTKMKDASLGEPVVFDMITVGLGVCDEDMVEIDTLVPELRGPASQEPDNTINPMALVEDEDRKLRRKGEVKRADLVTEVYIASNKTKRTAQKWVKELRTITMLLSVGQRRNSPGNKRLNTVLDPEHFAASNIVNNKFCQFI